MRDDSPSDDHDSVDDGSAPNASSSEPSPADSSLSTGSLIALAVAGLLVLVMAIPQISATLTSSADSGGSSPQNTQATGVDAMVVRPGPVTNQLQTTGTLRADESVALTSEASGKVTSIRFQEGERVQKGDLLLQINDDELQAERQRLEFRLDLARDRAERQKRLLAQGGVSQEEYDATVNQVNVLESS